MKDLAIGILGLQGDIEEHAAATRLAHHCMKLEGSVP